MPRQKGFTLIEVAVAIGVVSILSAILVPLIFKSIQDARISRTKAELKVIAAAIISQMKDTGGRPSVANGPGGATGAAGAVWYSSATVPGGGNAGNQTFTNLFGASGATANHLFGIPDNTPVTAEFAHKGPYLTHDGLTKVDPWGSSYIIYGYDKLGQDDDGPIWVVSAGPDKKEIADANKPTATVKPPTEWHFEGRSERNIVLRVH